MNEELLLRVLTGRASSAEEAAVAEWRAQSPENEREYQAMAQLLSLGVQAHRQRYAEDPPAAAEIAALWRQRESRAGAPSIPEGRGAPRIARASHWLRWAAVFVLGFGVSWWVLSGRDATESFGVRELVTGATETATASLLDGTVVRLAPQSRLRVLSRSDERHVSLSGRAYFAVAENPQRPFRIDTPAGEVTVLGTRFDLEANNEDLRIIVVEGTIDLSADGTTERVEAGQVGRVVKGTALPPQSIPDAALLLDWVGNFLAFQSTPLADAAREISRTYGVEIQIADTALAQRTITSWFADWTLAEVIEAVCVIAHAQCSTSDDVVRMEPR